MKLSVRVPIVIIFLFTLICVLQARDGLNDEIQTCAISAENNAGFFSDSPDETDRVIIRRYRTMTDKFPDSEIPVSDRTEITELISLLGKIPAKGDVFKKLAPGSRLCVVEFYAGSRKIGEAQIYNDTLRMPDTAFLSGKNNSADEFVAMVNKNITSSKVLPAADRIRVIQRLQRELTADKDGSIMYGRYVLSIDKDSRIRVKTDGWTIALIDNKGKVSALAKSRTQNERNVAAIEELLWTLAHAD